MKSILLPLLIIGSLGIIASIYQLTQDTSFADISPYLVASICCFGGWYFERDKIKKKEAQEK